MIPYFHALFIQRHGMISALMIYGRINETEQIDKILVRLCQAPSFSKQFKQCLRLHRNNI